MYSMTDEDGPEFEEGDEIVFTAGAFEGDTGSIAGYDSENDLYFVTKPGVPFLVSAPASILDLLDDWDEDDEGYDLTEFEPDGPLRPGDRVVVVHGNFIGLAGAVISDDPMFSRPLHRVLIISLDGGTKITISESSVERSIYQGEVLEAVPSV